MSVLYVVATPIGNLEDITLRALRVLKEVDIILCEDTRVTKKLLQKYDIFKPLLSYHSHSTIQRADEIIALLALGKTMALVSDAGTPCISDPGSLLVRMIRDQLPGVKIVPIPGPCALTAALSAAGVPASEFLFLGFLPHKKGRETLFREIANSERTVVFYESPHRIKKTLESLKKHAGEERKVIVARELTKIFEEVTEHEPSVIKGEFVVVVAPK
jgi:16S rRNA (cytidine1402-2'-O)-methyltransferase